MMKFIKIIFLILIIESVYSRDLISKKFTEDAKNFVTDVQFSSGKQKMRYNSIGNNNNNNNKEIFFQDATPTPYSDPHDDEIQLDHEFYKIENIDKAAVDIGVLGNSQPVYSLSNNDDGWQEYGLHFSFPFYGYKHSDIWASSNGILSIVPRSCGSNPAQPGFCHAGEEPGHTRYLQYIAPLLSDFNPAYDQNSMVNYTFSSDSLTIQWSEMTLWNYTDKTQRFTFGATIYQNGNIEFYYLKVPFWPSDEVIPYTANQPTPLKYTAVVGVEDAAIVYYNNSHDEIKRYGKLTIPKTIVKPGKVVLLRALPTCIGHDSSCEACVFAKDEVALSCNWCPEGGPEGEGRCENGLGREMFELNAFTCPIPSGGDKKFCSDIGKGISPGTATFLVILSLVIVFGSLGYCYHKQVCLFKKSKKPARTPQNQPPVDQQPAYDLSPIDGGKADKDDVDEKSDAGKLNDGKGSSYDLTPIDA